LLPWCRGLWRRGLGWGGGVVELSFERLGGCVLRHVFFSPWLLRKSSLWVWEFGASIEGLVFWYVEDGVVAGCGANVVNKEIDQPSSLRDLARWKAPSNKDAQRLM
jgi:hypothetical protein